MPRCLIALGGNLGDVELAFQRALDQLAEHPRIAVVRRSATFSTTPVGGSAGGPFLNAAAELQTTLEPLEVLDQFQALESQAGRARDRVRWSPRPLDLDLLFYDDRIVETARLTVPHPACWYRRFVLDPLATIAADFIHPVKQTTIAGLRERLLARPLPVAVAGQSAPPPPRHYCAPHGKSARRPHRRMEPKPGRLRDRCLAGSFP